MNEDIPNVFVVIECNSCCKNIMQKYDCKKYKYPTGQRKYYLYKHVKKDVKGE